jgi:hypothetical protein
VINFTEKQKAFLNSDNPYLLFCDEPGVGKTFASVYKMLLKCNKGQNGLVIAAYSGIIQDILRPAITQTFANQITHWNNSANATMTMNGKRGKAKIVFRVVSTFDDILKIKGLSTDWIYLPEANYLPTEMIDYAIKAFRGRPLDYPYQLFADCNPGADSNWVYNFFYKRKEHAEIIGNGQWESLGDTTVYDINSVEIVEGINGEDVNYYLVGIDPGENGPTGVVICTVMNNNDIIVVDTLKERRISIADIVSWIRFRVPRPTWQGFCDPARPSWITEAEYNGCFNVWQARSRLIADGIGALTSLINTKRLKINSTCFNILEEIKNYKYQIDGVTPAKKIYDPHLLDALRYAIMSDRHIWEKPSEETYYATISGQIPKWYAQTHQPMTSDEYWRRLNA